jgi:hypothetical protein
VRVIRHRDCEDESRHRGISGGVEAHAAGDQPIRAGAPPGPSFSFEFATRLPGDRYVPGVTRESPVPERQQQYLSDYYFARYINPGAPRYRLTIDKDHRVVPIPPDGTDKLARGLAPAGSYAGFNRFRIEDRYVAVPIRLGSVDIATLIGKSYGIEILEAHTLDFLDGLIDNRFENLVDEPTVAVIHANPGLPGVQMCFNRNREDFCESRGFPRVIQIEFTEPRALGSYYLRAGEQPEAFGRMPIAWSIEGSADGLQWVRLDARTVHQPWRPFEIRFFELDRPAQFPHYRLIISKAADPSVLRLHGVGLIPPLPSPHTARPFPQRHS